MGNRRGERLAESLGVYNGISEAAVTEFMFENGLTDPVQARINLTRILQHRSNYLIRKLNKPEVSHLHNRGRRGKA